MSETRTSPDRGIVAPPPPFPAEPGDPLINLAGRPNLSKMTITIPSCLDWLRSSAAGRTWLESLPDVVATCADQWNLDLGQPVDNSYVSLVVPATTVDGEPVMIKIQFPDRESQHEAAALDT